MTNTPMTSREAFEKWAESEGHKICRHILDHNDYADTLTFFMWNAYQACEAEQAKVIAELRKEINKLGEIGNVCTYNALGEICSYCNCKRKALAKVKDK